jgi:hypothetical protein
LSNNCISPPEVDEKQLWVYLDGGASEQTVLHLQRCSYCRERAQVLERFQNQLKGRLYRVTCPPSIELGEYHLRMLPDSQMLVIDQHVRQCPHCTRELSQLKDFLLNTDQGQPGLRESLRITVAKLIGADTDSSLVPAFGALRGTSKDPLIFEADGVIITLDTQAGLTGAVSLLGQMAADNQDNWTGASVELQQGDSPQQIVSLDDLGSFRFENIQPGLVQITITSHSGIQVQIPSIHVAS